MKFTFFLCCLINILVFANTVHCVRIDKPSEDKVTLEKDDGSLFMSVITQSGIRVEATPYGYPLFRLEFDSIFQSRQVDKFATDNIIQDTKHAGSAYHFDLGDAVLKKDKGSGEMGAIFNATTPESTPYGFSYVFHVLDDGSSDFKFDIGVLDVNEDDWDIEANYLSLCWKVSRKEDETESFVELDAGDVVTKENTSSVEFLNGTSIDIPLDKAKTSTGATVETHLGIHGKLACVLYKKFNGNLWHSATVTVSGSNSLTGSLISMMIMTFVAVATMFFLVM